MKNFAVHMFGLCVALSVQPAFAQDTTKPSFSADAVIEHMVKQVDLGSARGICVGTKSECEANQPKPQGFDMMLTFELDSAELLPEAKANLEVVAVALNDDRLRRAKFRVDGHTDAYGSDKYNLNLSEARARAVTDFLVQHNVERERIIASGMGESAPRADNPFDPANRRVELNLSVE